MVAQTVLLVEDDKTLQNLLREVLEREGFQVSCESDGEWAKKSLERRLPNVLISDVLIPTINGFELLAILRELPGGDEVQAFCMSGIYKSARHKDRAKERYGVRRFLEKPFAPSELVALLKESLKDDYPGVRAQKARAERLAQASTSEPDPLAGPATQREQDEVENDARKVALSKMKGNLRSKRFPELLSQLYRNSQSGALLVQREAPENKRAMKKVVYFQDGYPTYVKSNLLSECLGRVLVRAKMISEEECAESIRLMKAKKRQQGTMLVEMGCISPHNLVYGLQLQLETKLFDIFGWDSGDYRFNPKLDVPPHAVKLDMSMATIVYEGVRRRYKRHQLDNYLTPFERSFWFLHDDPLYRFQEIALEADERKMSALIDGTRTTEALVRQSPLGERETKALLYALFASEMIAPQNAPAESVPNLQSASRTLISAVPFQNPLTKSPPPIPQKEEAKKGKRKKKKSRPPPLKKRNKDETKDLRRALAARAREIQRMNYFEMLGISRRADVEEVRRAYYAAVRDLHPDRFKQNAPLDARAMAEQVHAQLEEAFRVLGGTDSRAEYEHELDAGNTPVALDGAGRILLAEGAFDRGRQALDVEAFSEAYDAFSEAAQLFPEAGEFVSHRGWALYRKDIDQASQALEDLKLGLSIEPSAVSYVLLGRVLRSEGKEKEAFDAFEAAMYIDPDCKEAIEALASSSSFAAKADNG